VKQPPGETVMTERRAARVSGIVQGVGFRPFVRRLASRYALGGFVRNEAGDVVIEVEGDAATLDRFSEELIRQSPPLARIDRVDWRPVDVADEREFRIQRSRIGPSAQILISPDVATCDDCLAELLDPSDRRYRYPFLNCTNCGPRLTIIRGAPYDRNRTTMDRFSMCAACRAEYEDPTDRRFHAQPIACHDCGPQLTLRNASGRAICCDDAIHALADALRSGKIVAMKGVGGYHLVCDARNASAVEQLRQRKQRDAKPFAIMVRDVAAAAELCSISAIEKNVLMSWRRPIVLLSKRPACDDVIAAAVAPENPCTGIMLPHTPLHHLLFRELNDVPLVMTSGNRSDEPIVYRDNDALERLGVIADVFVTHDRPIHIRCDDSVTRVMAGRELPVRRSRGDAPLPLLLPTELSQPILAVGGQLKNTFALGRGDRVIVSHHLGDLEHVEALHAFARDIELYERLFDVRPERIVHDLHPDYASTRYAVRRSAECDPALRVPLVAVQHHHAHMASCLLEHQLDGSAIGVIFDGTGLGTDGAIWGGEFLTGDCSHFERAGHLRYTGLPGGDRAVREPWRMAVSHLLDADCDVDVMSERIPASTLRTIRAMLEQRLNAPPTSSMGRLFDAVAAIIGIRDFVSYEGQAAMELEWLATTVESPGGRYPFDVIEVPATGAAESPVASRSTDAAFIIDTRPLIRAIADEVQRGTDRPLIARRFHSSVVEIIEQACRRIRIRTTLKRVVLSGGVFMNRVLTEETMARLTHIGFDVYSNERIPCNDGGLSPGQLAVAVASASRTP